MTLAAVIAFNGLLLCAVGSDIRSYRIPNAIPLLLAFAGPWFAPPATLAEAAARAAAIGLMGVLTVALWLRGWMGGGDVKLLTACAAWMTLADLPLFAMAVGLASGAQGLGTMAYLQLTTRTPLAAAVRRRIPYALSIAAAGLIWSLLRLRS
jgi:prepilin peptidase CpaA